MGSKTLLDVVNGNTKKRARHVQSCLCLRLCKSKSPSVTAAAAAAGAATRATAAAGGGKSGRSCGFIGTGDGIDDLRRHQTCDFEMNDNGNGTVTARAGDGRRNGGGRLPAEERWKCSELITFQIFRKSRTLALLFKFKRNLNLKFEI